jgi:hypothetical protein
VTILSFLVSLRTVDAFPVACAWRKATSSQLSRTLVLAVLTRECWLKPVLSSVIGLVMREDSLEIVVFRRVVWERSWCKDIYPFFLRRRENYIITVPT